MVTNLPSYPIFNLIVYLYLSVYCVYPIYRKKGEYYRRKSFDWANFGFFFIIVSFFCVFAFSNGDFYNYYEVFRNTIKYGEDHFEEVYVWIIKNITGSYLLWRFIVWGSSVFLMLLTLKRLSLKEFPSFAAVTLYYLLTLYIMRGNLGISILFYGISFLLKPVAHSRMSSYLLGALLIIISYSFHKSMLLSLALLPMGLINFNKTTLRISFLIFPIVVSIVRAALELMAIDGLADIVNNNKLSRYAEIYANQEAFSYNIMGVIRNIFIYAAPYIILIRAYRKNYMDTMPRYIRFFFNYWYVWVYIASACAFQELGGWYYSRFMYMSNYPLCIVMAYLFSVEKSNRFMRFIILLTLLGGMYDLSYSIYKGF